MRHAVRLVRARAQAARRIGEGGRVGHATDAMIRVTIICGSWYDKIPHGPLFIKEIGRGKNAAGDLSREDAQALFSAMLAGDVPGSPARRHPDRTARQRRVARTSSRGFAAACEASYAHLQPVADGAVPVVIPSYNGARQLPNLVPLLALLLAREGMPALVHGVTDDPGPRHDTRSVRSARHRAGDLRRRSAHAARHGRRSRSCRSTRSRRESPALLALRARARRAQFSTHTLVKMLQPFAGPAVRIVSVTHPEYLVRMREYFTVHDTAALLLRGAEGEAVAHPRREPAHGMGSRRRRSRRGRTKRARTPRRSAATASRKRPRAGSSGPRRQSAGARGDRAQVACCRRAVDAVEAGERRVKQARSISSARAPAIPSSSRSRRCACSAPPTSCWSTTSSIARSSCTCAKARASIKVGKRGGCKSTPQAFIERLMVAEAKAGRTVVRLKGGDPFIFGRGGEEAEALRARGRRVRSGERHHVGPRRRDRRRRAAHLPRHRAGRDLRDGARHAARTSPTGQRS